MPIPVISIAQMREWEKATWATGQTEVEVIRRVGKFVAQHALQMTRAGDLILILAGKGNNGADVRAARDHLLERRVDLLEVTDPATDFSKLNTLLSLQPALVIDGLFGIGINRPLSAEWIKFIGRVNEARAQILAVDVPSGLNGDTGEAQGAAIEATVTLTVGAPKIGMLRDVAWRFVGRLEVAADVGLVPCTEKSEVNWTAPGDFADFPPRRAAATHKGSYGHLAILAGSVGYHGAAILAARGAQRAQPGLVTLHTLGAIYHIVASQLQAVMVSPWKPDIKLEGHYPAILIGPGLAAEDMPDQMRLLTRHLWRYATVPVIADASALDWLRLEHAPQNAIRLITPHPGEAGRLLGLDSAQVQAGRLKAVRQLSDQLGNPWIVLKGHQTMIGRAAGEVFVNSSGNPDLAQGGSGDVLSGFLAGLLAQPSLRTDALKTIRYGVWEHGATADKLTATRANWVIEDLVNEIGTAR